MNSRCVRFIQRPPYVCVLNMQMALCDMPVSFPGRSYWGQWPTKTSLSNASPVWYGNKRTDKAVLLLMSFYNYFVFVLTFEYRPLVPISVQFAMTFRQWIPLNSASVAQGKTKVSEMTYSVGNSACSVQHFYLCAEHLTWTDGHSVLVVYIQHNMNNIIKLYYIYMCRLSIVLKKCASVHVQRTKWGTVKKKRETPRIMFKMHYFVS